MAALQRREAGIDVRAADLQEELTEQRFPFRRLDEDGGNPANIAASGASNQTERAMREQSEDKV